MPKEWEKTDGQKIADIISAMNQIQDRLSQIDRQMTEHHLDWIFTTWSASHDQWLGRINSAVADMFGELPDRIYSKRMKIPSRIEVDKTRNERG